ncbi:AraC-like DNA-binding protein [Rathayibacter sp. PhB93]|uniref:AraC family transcriptional regulator n=1 Tax=unclassified Rathayibacter TaxID=2609250 RepID=UPI000F991AA2|nr:MULTISPECIES: AraC family transcriptional regulator [unclassified Rathayibacter]ROQ04454.1 AraC-like DNA-binding protein [Rathayibacter sp. PhB93]TDQ13292.1 AraC-like DNA-binding protein [Rathayibacter sp. PhB1]
MDTAPSARYRTPDTSTGLGLYVFGAGRRAGVSSPVRQRVLSESAVVLIEQGRGEFRVGDETSAVEAGDALWVPAGVEHSYRSVASGWTEHWVLLAGSALEHLVAEGLLPRGAGVLHVQGGDASLLFAAVLDALEDTGAASVARSSARALLLLLRLSESRGRSRFDRRIERIALSGAGVEDAARELGLSLRALRARTEERTGASPIELFLRIRVDEAKALLSEGDLPVSAVARAVGYEDPGYFTRVFRARVGVTPSEFRSRHRR